MPAWPLIPGSLGFVLTRRERLPGNRDETRQSKFASSRKRPVPLPLLPSPYPAVREEGRQSKAADSTVRFSLPLRQTPWNNNKAVLSPVIVPKARDKPFLVRMQGFDSPADQRRLARFTEIVSAMVNSFLGTDQIVQTGVSSYKIQASPKPGSGKTGTFNSGAF